MNIVYLASKSASRKKLLECASILFGIIGQKEIIKPSLLIGAFISYSYAMEDFKCGKEALYTETAHYQSADKHQLKEYFKSGLQEYNRAREQNDSLVFDVYCDAIIYNDFDQVRALQYGWPAKVANKHGETLLWMACCFDRFDIAEFFIDQPDVEVHCPALNTSGKYPPLSYVCTAYNLSHNQRMRLMKKLLDKGAVVNYRNGNGETPLWEAIVSYSEITGVIPLLLSHGALLVPNKYGLSPLLVAIRGKRFTQVKELLESDQMRTTNIALVIADFNKAKAEFSRDSNKNKKEDLEFIERCELLAKRQ